MQGFCRDDYLPGTIKGQFLRLYMVLDVFSRLIVGWEVHCEESAENASTLVGKACLRQGIRPDQLALHSDNGSPMKGATMLATLQKLGVVPSFSRPSVSDDNPYSEALFRTLKYTPAYPRKRFEDLDKEILQKRKAVYEAAKCSKPGRWKSRQTRNWGHIKEVWLNPPREHLKSPEKVAMAV